MRTAADMTTEGPTLHLLDEPACPRASGALWLPGPGALVVSDLHLGKAERNVRRGGGFWPPYENEETLNRLEAEIAALDPACVVALGDSFDDDLCAGEMDAPTRERIDALARARRWIWITGNHDPAPSGLPGESARAATFGSLVLRHIAEGEARGEVSGHYHPKVTLRVRGRRIVRKCFLTGGGRMVMPAFGAFTGGLDVFAPAFAPLFDRDAAVVLTGTPTAVVPLARLRRSAA